MSTSPGPGRAGRRRRRRVALAAAVLGPLLATAGCTTGDGGGMPSGTAAQPGGESPAVASADRSTAAPPGASLAAGDRPAPSAGSVTGAFLATGTAPPERTISVSAQGLAPAVLEVAAGQAVTFAAGDDGSYSIVVGDLAGASVAVGVVGTYGFGSSGTYPVLEELSGAAATIVVR